MIKHLFKAALLIFSLIIFFFSIKLQAQEPGLLAADTTSQEPEIYNLAEISIKSAELTLKAKKLVKNAINEDKLNSLKQKNIKVINNIDSLLARETYVKLNSLSIRNLNSKLIYWQQNLQTVNNQQSELSKIFDNIEESTKNLYKDLDIWQKTDESVGDDELAQTVHNRIGEIQLMIDTTTQILNQKGAQILSLLDEIARLDVEIRSLITNIEAVILDKQEDILVTNQPSLFGIDYRSKSNWTISELYLKYYKGNYYYFINYLEQHLELIVIHFFLIIILIFLFIKLNRLNVTVEKGEGSVYVKLLKVLISKPISVALIIGIFGNALIYPYRPIMFLDLSRILLTIPIVFVLVNILGKKYRIYAYIFGLLVIIYVFSLNLPVEYILSRLILFFITALLTVSLVYLIIVLRREKEMKKNNIRFFIYFSYLLFTMSFFGFVANIIGKVTFSVFMVQGVLGILLAGILISLLLVVVNGLVVLTINNKYGDQLNIIKKNKVEAKHKLTRLFNVIATLLLIYFVLDIFRIQGAIIDWLTEFFLQERHLGSMVFTWGNIFIFFIVIYLSIVISGFIRMLLEDDVLNKMNMKKGLPYTIALIVKYSLVTAGIFLAVSAAGIPTTSLTVVIGAFGVGIGFGLQNIFNNLVSGLILLFERPIQLGDTIEVGTLMGNVRSIGIRSSNVRTFDGAEIIVPNGNLISNEVINWTLSDERRRIELIVGVSYSSDPHKVEEVLMNVIKNHPDIESDPEPSVWFQNLGDSSLDFRMLFWTKEFNQWIRIKSDILFQVFDDLKKAGIEIPFPQRDLHVRSVHPDVNLNKGTTEKPS